MNSQAISSLAYQHRARFVGRHSLLGRGATGGLAAGDVGSTSPSSASSRFCSTRNAQTDTESSALPLCLVGASSRLKKLTAMITSQAAAKPVQMRRHDQKSSFQIRVDKRRGPRQKSSLSEAA